MACLFLARLRHLRSELIDFFIAELLRLHSKTFKQIPYDQYLTQKNRVNKELTTGMTALIFFGLFERAGRGAYLLTALGEHYYRKLIGRVLLALALLSHLLYFSAHSAFASGGFRLCSSGASRRS
jgi:hypothetical protein